MARNFGRGAAALLAMLLGLGATAALWADDAILAELERCAAIAASTERLACYDGLARSPAPAAAAAEPEQPQVAAEPVTAPAAEPEPEPVPVAAKTLDDLDAETRPKRVGAEAELTVRARLGGDS